MGITLGCKPVDVTFYLNRLDQRGAAYKYLCWTEDNYDPAEKWEKIIEALAALDKNNTIRELRLEERLSAAAKVNKKEQFGWSPDKPPSLPNLILVHKNLLLTVCAFITKKSLTK